MPGNFSFAFSFSRINRPVALVILTALAIAYYRYGWPILNPGDVFWPLWLYNDTLLHFVSWHFYRYDDWAFPLGLMPNLQSPIGGTVGLSDALPLLAIPFKALSPILPQDFQYFGLWLSLCIVLQAVFGYKLVSLYTPNHVVPRILGSLFFIFTAFFLIRILHPALHSHWMLLAALYLYLSSCRQFRWRVYCIAWCLLLATTSLTHIYLTFMVCVIFGCSVIYHLFSSGNINIRQAGILISGSLLIVILTLWQAGYFHIGTHMGIIRDFIDPVNAANILGSFYRVSNDDHAYLGQGTLILAIIGLSLLIYSNNNKQQAAHRLRPHNFYYSALACLPYVFIGLVWGGLTYQSFGFSRSALPSLDFINLANLLDRLFLPIVYLVFLAALPLLVKRLLANRKMRIPLRACLSYCSPHWALAIALIAFTVYSWGGHIYLGPYLLYQYEPSSEIGKYFTDVFRFPGRFVWPASYLILLAVLVLAIRQLSSRIAAIFLFCALLVQVAEVYPLFMDKRLEKDVTAEKKSDRQLLRDRWRDKLKPYDKVYHFHRTASTIGYREWEGYLIYLTAGKKINFGWSARNNHKKKRHRRREDYLAVMRGQLDKDAVALFTMDDTPENADIAANLDGLYDCYDSLTIPLFHLAQQQIPVKVCAKVLQDKR